MGCRASPSQSLLDELCDVGKPKSGFARRVIMIIVVVVVVIIVCIVMILVMIPVIILANTNTAHE